MVYINFRNSSTCHLYETRSYQRNAQTSYCQGIMRGMGIVHTYILCKPYPTRDLYPLLRLLGWNTVASHCYVVLYNTALLTTLPWLGSEVRLWSQICLHMSTSWEGYYSVHCQYLAYNLPCSNGNAINHIIPLFSLWHCKINHNLFHAKRSVRFNIR